MPTQSVEEIKASAKEAMAKIEKAVAAMETVAKAIDSLPSVTEQELSELEHVGDGLEDLMDTDAPILGRIAEAWVQLGVRSGLGHITDPATYTLEE